MTSELNPTLEGAFPAATDAEVLSGIEQGVKLADDLIRSTPMLRHLGGYDLRGHLRRVGIMYRMHDLCAKKQLPFTTEIVQMPHGPWHWLEIRSGKFKAHVCRTSGPYEFPEDTLSRQDERLRNQPDLFNDTVIPLNEIAERARELYTWLNFGADRAGNILHVCWAMPPADDSSWLAHVDVMERFKRNGPRPKARSEEIPKKLKLEFREHVEKSLPKRGTKTKE